MRERDLLKVLKKIGHSFAERGGGSKGLIWSGIGKGFTPASLFYIKKGREASQAGALIQLTRIKFQ